MPKIIAVIQAGGKGTRMRSMTGDKIPKPMLLMNGKPMLQWQMEQTASYGIREFIVIIGHLGEKIEAYFGDGSEFGYQIHYIWETEPLGSAGSLYGLRDYPADTYLVIFGDVMFQIDMERFLAFHREKGARATLLAHPNSHPGDSDLLLMDNQGRVNGILSKKEKRCGWYHNCVNAGIYLLDRSIVEQMNMPTYRDMEADVLTPLMSKGDIFGYCTPEYVKDAGTPERFYAVSEAQRKGVWTAKCLKSPQRCIFLDRDGTLNRFKGLITDENELELEPYAAEAVRRINDAGWLVVVVTNQPVLARGICTEEQLNTIHEKLETLLGQKGAYLDDIFFCPHHPDRGYPGEVAELKVRCDCRKPATGLIERAAKKYNIDLAASYIIGDTTRDIQTGINAGLRTILLHTGKAGKDGAFAVKAELEADNLLEAVQLIFDDTLTR